MARRQASGFRRAVPSLKKSVSFARTACASPVVNDETDPEAHGEVLQSRPPSSRVRSRSSEVPRALPRRSGWTRWLTLRAWAAAFLVCLERDGVEDGIALRR